MAAARPLRGVSRTEKPPFDAEAERDALEAFVVDFLVAWHRHDGSALSRLWVEDGDLLNTRGRMARGQAEVQALLTEEHHGPMRKSRATMALSRLRFLSPTLVSADAEMALENVLPASGPALPTVRMHVSFLARKSVEGWRYVSVRPYAFLSGF